jgi:stage II sporulation protein D
MMRCASSIVILLLAALLLIAPGCDRSTSTTPPPSPAGSSAATAPPLKKMGEPIIRVRLVEGSQTITITAPSRVQLQAVGKPESRQLLSTPVTIRRVSDSWQIAAPDVRTPMPRDVLRLEPLGPVNIAIANRPYPGSIQLVPIPADANPALYDRFDIINHVNLEAYLPGVLDKELYDHWKPAAYLAQAIAARTYAIDRIMEDGPGRHFDVESTQASQAYAGKTAHDLALRAAADTAGLVVTFNGKVFTTYYSSTCGGMGQNPTDAFGKPSITPLNPIEAHTWCSHSKHYTWGPITHDRKQLSRRIAAWGNAVRSPIAALGEIYTIRASHVNALNRPVRFEITDDKGRTYALRGENLRLAVNYASTAQRIEAPPTRLPSSFTEPRIEGDKVIFIGRGYGHGVGLCQYGAEGMARAGQTPEQIIAHSYPGSKIERAY